uniref:G_PROTEIN_RECEP_F1_2 domain-containing protein n=1 Tax=Steinernema glaseri TaxID=37863 RepID=A0A1I8A9V9_9BILA
SCSKLIALQAFTDMVTAFGHPIFFYLSWTEQLVSFRTCFWLQFIPCSGMNWSTAVVMFIGLDRLCCVRYPTWYATLNKARYLLSICACCFAYDALNKIVGYFTIAEQMTVCVIAEAYSGLGRFVFVGSQVLLNIMVVIVYQKLRSEMMEARRTSRLGNKETNKVYKAVNTVMICYILGWLTTMVSLGVTMIITLDVFLTVAVEAVVGVFANINLACPLIVYYYRSSLYRKEIRKVFGFADNAVYVHSSSQSARGTGQHINSINVVSSDASGATKA